MKFKKISRTPKFIEYTVIVQGHQALEERDVKCKEMPLESLTKGLDALVPVAVKINELRDNKAMNIIALEITETKNGTRSAKITYDRVLDATDQAMQFATPRFRIEDPSTGDEGRRECTPSHAKLIEVVIEEAIRYINGERQQGLLPGITDDSNRPSGDDDGDDKEENLFGKDAKGA